MAEVLNDSALIIMNTEARKYMDETKKIATRAEAVEAVRKLWRYHSQMERFTLTLNEDKRHPAILDLIRVEIHRLKIQFDISNEEELADPEAEAV